MKKPTILVGLLLALAHAHAKPVAHAVSDDGQTLTVHDTVGACAGGRRQAFLAAPDGTVLFRGCWALRGRAVHVAWEDTDESLVPMSLFTVLVGV